MTRIKHSLIAALTVLLLVASVGAREAEVINAIQTIDKQLTFDDQLDSYLNQYDALAYRYQERELIYLSQEAQAQYLAFKSDLSDSLREKLLLRYRSGEWTTKQALLPILAKLPYDEVKQSLIISARMEDDEEIRLEIEKNAYQIQSVHQLNDEPITDQVKLLQWWAGYLATGNTQVVQASVELLTNTITGYSIIINGSGQQTKKIFTHRKRLNYDTVQLLRYFCLQDQRIRQTCTSYPALFTLQEMIPVFEELAAGASFHLDQALLASLIQRWQAADTLAPDRLLYYQTLLTGINDNVAAIKRKISQFRRRSPELTLALLGQYYHIRYRRDRETWQSPKLLFNKEKQQAVDLAHAALMEKSWQCYEYWVVNNQINHRESREKPIYEVLLAKDLQEQREVIWSNSDNSECWVLDQTTIYRWNQDLKRWFPINNQMVAEQLRRQLATSQVQSALASTQPKKVERIERENKSALIKITFEQIKPFPVILSMVNKLNLKIKSSLTITLIIDEKTGQLISSAFDLPMPDAKMANLTVTRVYATQDKMDLNWIKVE